MDHAQAYELIGICACAIRDTLTAREAALHFRETRRELVRAACGRFLRR